MEIVRRETVEHVVRAAFLAPRLDPSRPCVLNWHKGLLQVSLDPAVAPDLLDQTTRRLLISAGAAVQHARVAARGLSLGVTFELMPNATSLASIALTPGAAPDALELELELAAALVDRHVAGGDPDHGSPPEEIVDVLRVALAAEGAGLKALRPADDAVALDVITRLEAGVAAREARPAVAVVTSADGPRDWLVAGAGLGAVTLTAAMYGVLADAVIPATEPQSRRTRLRALLGVQGFPQLVLRLSQLSGQFVAPRRAAWPDVVGAPW